MNQIVILAAGKGTRMNSDLPKVLFPLKGEPMIKHLLREVAASGVCARPIIVVSPENQEIMKNSLREFNCAYAIQEQQLGTGHAFACSKDLVTAKNKNLIGFYGDHPFVKKETIQNLLNSHKSELTMMTVQLPDFEGWHHNFYHWGRIIRDREGKIIEIKEFKDADEETRKITEVNPSFFCFDSAWFWDNVSRLKNDNRQAEYYLTDMVKLAFDAGLKINTLPIGPHEAMGVNSQEELQIAEGLMA